LPGFDGGRRLGDRPGRRRLGGRRCRRLAAAEQVLERDEPDRQADDDRPERGRQRRVLVEREDAEDAGQGSQAGAAAKAGLPEWSVAVARIVPLGRYGSASREP